MEASKLPLMEAGESSARIRERVLAARAIQAERYRGMSNVHTNSEVKSRDLPEACRFSIKDRERLVRMIERLNLSARAYDKVLRVARTLADLAGVDAVREEDVVGALTYRRLDDENHSFWL